MIELHWAFIVVYLLVDYGLWVWRGHRHRKEKQLLKEEVAGLERAARMGRSHMIGTWGVIFALRGDASAGRRPSASAMTKHLDELINIYWKDPEAARQLIAREARKMAEILSTKKGEDK